MESCWLQITSGRCPSECEWVVRKLSNEIKKQASKLNIKIDEIQVIPGSISNCLKSILLSLKGSNLSQFTSQWKGTVGWIGKSPFRPNHKRKNWYVGVNVFFPPDSLYFSEKEISVEVMRASGPGGQHVNKSETAVRITHLPTKIRAVAQEERSQSMNKKLALARLKGMVEDHSAKNFKRAERDRWQHHNTLVRGNPVRIYQGKKFELVL